MAETQDPTGESLNRLQGAAATMMNAGVPMGPVSGVQNAAFKSFLDFAESLGPAQLNLQKAIPVMQTWVKTLNNAGVPLGALSKQVGDLTGNAKMTEQVMAKFNRSLTDLAKMSPGEFFKKGDFSFNVHSLLKGTLDTLAFDMAAMFESFKYAWKGAVALDNAGISLNKTLLFAAANANKLGASGGSGVGGLFGRLDIPNAFNKAMQKSLEQMVINLAPLGVGRSDAYKMVDQVIPKLLRSQVGASTGVVEGASYYQKTAGVGLDTALEFFSSVMRRTGKTGDDLRKEFQGVLDTTKKTNLTNNDGLNTVLELWNTSRLFGGTLKSANDALSKYHDQIENQTLTAQQVGAMQQTAINAPVQSIAALYSMAKITGSPALKTLFGGATSIPQALGNYISQGGDLGTKVPSAIADIITRMSKRMTPAGAGSAERTGMEMITAQGLMQTFPLQLQRSVLKILEPSLFPTMASIGGRAGGVSGDIDSTSKALSRIGQQARNAAQTLQNFGNVLSNLGVVVQEKILGGTRGINGLTIPDVAKRQGKYVIEILLKGGELLVNPVATAAEAPFEIAIKNARKALHH